MANKKINIYYKDSKGKHHYMHSTNMHSKVKDAVASAKTHYAIPMYNKISSKSIGEPLVISKIYGSFK